MLKLDDIVALAKQGYKPSDVKELIELSKEAEPAEQEMDSTKNTVAEIPKEPDNLDKPIKSEEAEKDSDKVVDYKEKVEELEAKLSALQLANTKQNIADTDVPSDSEVFADLMKSFM